jgi:lactam utilization protein B
VQFLFAIVALCRVQELTLEFVKAHVQGIRNDTAKQTMELKTLTQKVAKLEMGAARVDVKKMKKRQLMKSLKRVITRTSLYVAASSPI